MDLTIAERLTALGVVPAKGNMITLRLIQSVSLKLGFSAEELKKFGLKTELGAGGQMTSRWDDEYAASTCDIALEPAEIELLTQQLDELDKRAELTVQHITLYEKMHDKG